MATLFLNLTLPTPSVTLGPTWAAMINTAFEVIDEHDHSSGKGKQVPSSGININADLDFNSFRPIGIASAKFDNLSATLTGSSYAGSISQVLGDLWYTNSSGVAVQITAGGSLPVVSGGVDSFERTDVATDVIISPSDTFVFISVDTSGGDVQITLPLASAVTDGRLFIIKDVSGDAYSNEITVITSGSDTIDGSSSYIMNSGFGSIMVIGNGTDIWAVS